MNRKSLLALIALVVLSTSIACHSLNQVAPKGMDDTAIETEVRARIATSVPGKTFGIQIKVDKGVVTLNGNVDSASDKSAIGDAAQQVEGVRAVVNNLAING
ncbi:MAG: BON domain-containing protein [Acidobacteriota bacterium]